MNDFIEALQSLIGYWIDIYSRDHKWIRGKLVDVKHDHLVLEDEYGHVLYVNLLLIEGVSNQSTQIQPEKFDCDYINEKALHQLLDQFKHRWVTINCHNDQSYRGILSRVFEDYLVLINADQIYRIKNEAISNFFQGDFQLPSTNNSSNEENNNDSSEASTGFTSSTQNYLTTTQQHNFPSDDEKADDFTRLIDEVEATDNHHNKISNEGEQSNTTVTETVTSFQDNETSIPYGLFVDHEEYDDEDEEEPSLYVRYVDDDVQHLEQQYYALMKYTEKMYHYYRNKQEN
jgi:hypothetical protein